MSVATAVAAVLAGGAGALARHFTVVGVAAHPGPEQHAQQQGAREVHGERPGRDAGSGPGGDPHDREVARQRAGAPGQHCRHGGRDAHGPSFVTRTATSTPARPATSDTAT
ncbi:MAG: hypothetical protein ACKOTH_05650 [Solirubrobacterales bacterium]